LFNIISLQEAAPVEIVNNEPQAPPSVAAGMLLLWFVSQLPILLKFLSIETARSSPLTSFLDSYCTFVAGHKFIEVPRRQRTGDFRQTGPHLKSFTLELPATPFHPRTDVEDSVPATTAQRTPGIPANTPMAAEVLASLCALGLQFPAAGQVGFSPAVTAIAKLNFLSIFFKLTNTTLSFLFLIYSRVLP
jgi:hypothetical protein